MRQSFNKKRNSGLRKKNVASGAAFNKKGAAFSKKKAARQKELKTKARLYVTAAAFSVLFASAAYFEYLYVNGFAKNALCGRERIIFAVSLALTAAATVTAFAIAIKNDGFVYKICLATIMFLTALTVALYVEQKIGLSKILRDVTALREKIAGFGAFAVPAFIILQILQVTALPIPGLVTTAAGVALFGCMRGWLYSFIGITLGSFIAFFIGRRLGYKAASSLCGEKQLAKLLKKIEGKDKAVLTAAFFLPFFPDDLLCFAAGLSSMSGKYFCLVITLSRLISGFFTAYSLGGRLLPYDTWWGVTLWFLIIIGALFAAKKIYEKGEDLQARLMRYKRLWKILSKKAGKKACQKAGKKAGNESRA